MILETERLTLREMCEEDYADLCEILQDGEAMYAYEHAFSDEEASEWLSRQQKRYADDGFGLWAVIGKESGEFLGQCGLTMQDCGDKRVVEVGYLFKRRYWRRGYATEAAIGCRDYAFDRLGQERVYSIIRDSNISSQRVAERNGMKRQGEIVKHYMEMEMPHYVYCIEVSERKQRVS